MIKHVKGGYKVVSESGRSLGMYRSYADAVRRLKQVEMFKHMKDGKDK